MGKISQLSSLASRR